MSKRPTCTCAAYPWPHRPNGGLCRGSEPPLAIFVGTPGRKAPNGSRRDNSAIRRRLMKRYCFHPIRDRELIRRWLPKLYIAQCYRYGRVYPERWLGGYVPAMRVTGLGRRDPNAREPGPFPPGYRFGSWYSRFTRERRSRPLRCVEKRRARGQVNGEHVS